MIIFTVTPLVRDEIAAALISYEDDARMLGALGRAKKGDHPLITAGLVQVWPSDADGCCRIALSDAAGTLAWRAMAIADIAAGRDITTRLADRLGVETQGAFAYIDKYTTAIGQRWPRLTQTRTGQNDRQWTRAAEKVLAGRRIPMPCEVNDMPAFDKNVRRRAYASMVRARLTLPPIIHDRESYFTPRASSLFLTPIPIAVAAMFSAEDEEALAELAV